jgi:hypothetical protein
MFRSMIVVATAVLLAFHRDCLVGARKSQLIAHDKICV